MASPRYARLLAAALPLAVALGIAVPLMSSGPPAQAGAQLPAGAHAPQPLLRWDSPHTPHERQARARLATRVADALHGSTARVDYRIQIPGVGAIWHHPNRPSAPASNEKILTAATLLHLVGPDYRYLTTVAGTAPIDPNGTLDGDLVLTGSGDPTFTTADLRSLAGKLRRAGLRRVTGDLVVDDSRYGHGTRAPGWKHSFLPDETGPVDAFTVNNNDWRSGQHFQRNPSRANAGLWQAALKRRHIRVSGDTVVARSSGDLVQLVIHRSRPLSKIVGMTLRESINFYAEMMLREAGYQESGHGSRRAGIRAVEAVGHELGLPVGTVNDGSGLSYADRETPKTILRWLSAAPLAPYLAVACQPDGTLRYRLCGRNVKDNVHAKTGTLDHVSALSGYLTDKAGRSVTFSFLLNRIRNTTRAIRHLDAAVAALARSR